jgi:predicted GH43/DUF377 family glycosyl hydrolase
VTADLGGGELVRRVGPTLRNSPGRTILRPFIPGRELVTVGVSRADAVVGRVLTLSEEQVDEILPRVVRQLAPRHGEVRRLFREHADLAGSDLTDGVSISPQRRELLGAYLTQEYAVEGAALFNPSVVPHPHEQNDGGELPFVMTLRAVGEGHISSLELRTGVVSADGAVRIHHPGRRVVRPEIETPTAERDRGYRAVFAPDSRVSERVLFPVSADERQGIEDARLVPFRTDPEGPVEYLGTYTAYDGATVTSRLLSTTDFRSVETSALSGPVARDKGMALFPRPVSGRRLAIARRDRETLVIADSRDGLCWNDTASLQQPRAPWELVQLGVCAPPVETTEGWLVITHGVGPVRQYSIGALLLDLEDPTLVRGVLDEPLLTPTDEERIGYVPNVVYTCGALVHGEFLLLPYACSDLFVRFAVVDLRTLLDRLTTPRYH